MKDGSLDAVTAIGGQDDVCSNAECFSMTRLRKWLEFYFTIDLRSLGLFRILLGCFLVYVWWIRWIDLEAFFTSFGVLPSDAPDLRSAGIFHLSLLNHIASLPAVRLFFLFGLFCHACLLLGYRTRLFQVASFLFWVDVRNRNLIICDDSDAMIGTMLLWSLFLPMGERFSLDAALASLRRVGNLGNHDGRLGGERSRCRPSPAAFAIMCQIGLVYFLGAFLKFGRDWMDGTAVYYAVSEADVARPFGHWLAAQPLWLIRTLTWGTLAVEFSALPLSMAPFLQPFSRRAAVVVLTALQIGFGSALALGCFPWIMVGSCAVWLMEDDWRLLTRWALRWSRPAIVYYDDACGVCRWFCRWIAVADHAGNLRFIGTSQIRIPERGFSKDELDRRLFVCDRRTGERMFRSVAVAAVSRALPLPFHIFRLAALPGLSYVSDAFCDVVVRNGHRLYRWSDGAASEPLSVSTWNSWHGEDGAVSPGRFMTSAARMLTATAACIAFIVMGVQGYNYNMAFRLHRDPIRMPLWIQAVSGYPGLEPEWDMFAPDPPKDSGWWVIDGTTESGTPIDPLTGKAPTFEKPADLSTRYDSAWANYFFWISAAPNRAFCSHFAQYIIRKNNRDAAPGGRLKRFRIYFMQETTPSFGDLERIPIKRMLVLKSA